MLVLVIMDGFGIRKKKKGNAIKLQGTPFLDKLCKRYPNMLLGASENCVGLPKNQMGNSEAGHLTIGAGRRFYQPLERVNQAIKNKSFFENKQLLGAINHAKKNNSTLHVMGLISDGGVHSHIAHLEAVLELAHQQGVENVAVHAILDGRDTGVKTAKTFVMELEVACQKFGAKIKTLCGRAWAMDRDRVFERTEKAYRLIVNGRADIVANNPLEEIDRSYRRGVTDEFFEPVVLDDSAPFADNDALVLCNLRKDRMRQFLQALVDKKFDKFEVRKFKNLKIVGLVEYGEEFDGVDVAFEEEELKNCFSDVLEQNKKTQFHISETTKFAHVTYYFNCGQETPHKFEEQKILEGNKDLDFSACPEMRAFDITKEVLERVASNKFDFIVVNFPNCDMVGHTANMEATKVAVRVVDKCVYAIAMATLMAGGECIITADHGNAEELLDAQGLPKTSHTTNPVPFVLVGDKPRKLVREGELANIAPTMLEIMGLEIPPEMTTSLLRSGK